jgi:hypothetical protein
MRRRTLRFPRILPGLRAAGAVLAVWSAAACHTIDTTRQAPPKATLGDDIYGVLCDRVGASVLSEDPNGGSYQGVCHFDAQGRYSDKVDETLLPPAANEADRKLAVAKLGAMVKRRAELIRALNATFPDTEIDDAVKNDGSKIRLHDALTDFTQKLTPLYETNPYDAKGAPLFATSTRSIARMFEALSQSKEARDALTRIWGRQGYRPFQVGLGAMRPAIAYPNLRKLAQASLKVLGPDGTAVPELQQLLTIVKQELLTSKPVVAPLPRLIVDPDKVQPNRPRTTLEVTASLLLTEHDSFAQSDMEPHRYIALRDHRGFAATAPSKSPFVDMNTDGEADVDGFGRFVDASGKPLPIDPPFAIPGVTTSMLDDSGRPMGSIPLFQYLDTSRTVTGAVARHLVPLVDATETTKGDPDAWKNEHETLMYSLAGAYLLYGDREDAQYDYAADQIREKGESCPTCVPYKRFHGEDSPLADLIHATGQIMADPDSDALLASLTDLMENHESTVARLLGASLKVREIAAAHDDAAAKSQEALAQMPYETPIWDEMGALISDIVEKHPGLLMHLLEALADDTVISQQGPSQHMGQTIAAFMENRDELQYDQSNINGPAVNLTIGAPATNDPKSPVDQTQPKTGKNRSCMQRSFKTIHDANGGPACNKDNAIVKAKLGGLTVSWPLLGPNYAECELFQFDNLATFYLDSILDINHPKRSLLDIKSSTLNGIMNFLGALGQSPDDMFQQSSGITGLTLHPAPPALNRLVFFGASQGLYPSMPDHDSVNEGGLTDTFVSNLIEPVSCAYCPPDGMGAPQCPTPEGTVRGADPNTIFLWERLGFYNYLQPVVTAFANDSCRDTPLECVPPGSAGPTCCVPGAPERASCGINLAKCSMNPAGEQLFVSVVDILNRHWPGKEHGPECSKTGTAQTNGQYCSEAGVNTYEPILAETFKGDMIPALHEFAKVAVEASKVVVKRGPAAGQTWTGAQVLEKMTRILFSTAYAKSVGMVDRKGNAGTTWVDGTPQPQLTAFALFTDALHKMDTRWTSACNGLSGQAATDCQTDAAMRRGQWKRARSQLVDEFLAVDGSGAAAAFHNRAMPRTTTALLRVAREQLNARCPDRETGGACPWAKKDLGDKLASTLSGPLFGALMDVQEKLRADEPSRRELERLLSTVLAASSSGDALQGMLASLSDILQILSDDGNFSPIFNAISTISNPAGDKDGPGAADTTIKVLKALTGDEYDRYHVLDHVLPALVTPLDGDKSPSPIEIFMDTIADVNRLDASKPDPLDTEDYKAIMGTMNSFMTNETRGLEQFYTIIQKRPRE